MTIRISVNLPNSAEGTGTPDREPNRPLDGIGSGNSSSGNKKLLYGSYATIALTFSFLMAVYQPGPPPWEWVTRIPGPILSKSADTASETTAASKGPVLGVICL